MPTLVTNVGVESFAWTPDGTRIVFNGYQDGNSDGIVDARDYSFRDLYIINTDGSGLTNLTNKPAEYFFAVSPR